MKCVEYHPRYKSQIIALFEPSKFKQLIWQWQFESNPWGRAFKPILVVDDNDIVLGFNGVMPVKVLVNGVEQWRVWSCDFYVLKQYRGQGVGQMIKKRLQADNPKMMAFGVSDMADKVLRKMGWQQKLDVYNYRYSRDWRSLRSFTFTLLQLYNRRHHIFQKKRLLQVNNRLNVHAVLPSKEHVDQLWQSVASDYGLTVDRSYAYLHWKYESHPLANYAFVAVFDDFLEALMVVRYHDGILKILDYIGPRNNTFIKAQLLHFTQQHWQHAHQISITVSGVDWHEALTSCGFVRLRSRPRFFSISIADKNENSSDTDQDWFLMAGDSDGELLQAAKESGYLANIQFHDSGLELIDGEAR